MNKVILIGNLGKDPEVRTLDGGRKVANFSLATTERYKDSKGDVKDQTEWHNIVVWGASADYVEKYITKGNKISIEGKIRYRQYDDKEGTKKYITEILCDRLENLTPRTESPRTESYSKKSEPYLPPTSNNEQDYDDLPF